MAYAKYSPYLYERSFDRVDYRGLAIYTDSCNGDVIPSQEAEMRDAVARLRAAGVLVRTIKGVYGSRREANALRGWMVFIADGDYTPEQRRIIDAIDGEAG
jgi:hypothetical protein